MTVPQSPYVENFPQTVAPDAPRKEAFITPGASFRSIRAVSAAQQNMFLPDLNGMRIMGFAAMETASTAARAEFRLWHGRDATTGRLLLPISLLPDESTRDWYGPSGIEAPYGIWLEWVSGTFDLVVFYATELLDVYARS